MKRIWQTLRAICLEYLLDSHAVLWYVLDDPRLSTTAKTLVADPSNAIQISAASFWEIAVKISIGKLILKQPYDRFIDTCLNRYSFSVLAIQPSHTTRLLEMPFHHRDPFDRMLAAQSLVEGIPIISNDPVLRQYGVATCW